MERRTFLRAAACTVGGLATGLTGVCLTAGEALARGASAEESARAKRILAQMPAPATRTSIPRNGVISLAPGDVVAFESLWFCLDSNLAIPSSDEPMAFRPAANYIAPALRPLYMKLLHSITGKAPEDIQVTQILYAMRSEPGPQRLLKARDYAYVNALLPNAKELLQTAPRPSQYVSAVGLSLWASKPMPPAVQRYSLLRSDGVAGEGICLDAELVRGVVANASTKEFILDPSQWVLESSRDVQALGIAQPRTLRVAKSGNAAPQAPVPAPEKKPLPAAGPQKNGQPADGFVGH